MSTLTATFKRQKFSPKPVATLGLAGGVAQACDRLRDRARELGLALHDVNGDGHCFFRTLAVLLKDTLSFEAARDLVGGDCTHDRVREFLCAWAERHADFVIDDEGEETLAKRAADAATTWRDPVREMIRRSPPARCQRVCSDMGECALTNAFVRSDRRAAPTAPTR